MSIDTWLERIIKIASKEDNLQDMLDYGHILYKTLPTLRNHLGPDYTPLLQEKHDYVLRQTLKKYGVEHDEDSLYRR